MNNAVPTMNGVRKRAIGHAASGGSQTNLGRGPRGQIRAGLRSSSDIYESNKLRKSLSITLRTPMQNDIDAKHKRALQWFADHAGTVIAWPKPLDGGILLATKAKGIYKPRGCRYAQSVRQAIGAPYPDQDPSHDPAGRWEFRYSGRSRSERS
ncbi:MAG: hypothetical protein HZY79_14280 [Rhodoblastus sp.]|nr:MAG: hypothetical protein HZY79_14280 [Rhodoblastus sp.]